LDRPAPEYIREFAVTGVFAELHQDLPQIDVESAVDDQPKCPVIFGMNAEKHNRLPEIGVGEIRHRNQQMASK
jgi:hypothetical protein